MQNGRQRWGLFVLVGPSSLTAEGRVIRFGRQRPGLFAPVGLPFLTAKGWIMRFGRQWQGLFAPVGLPFLTAKVQVMQIGRQRPGLFAMVKPSSLTAEAGLCGSAVKGEGYGHRERHALKKDSFHIHHTSRILFLFRILFSSFSFAVCLFPS